MTGYHGMLSCVADDRPALVKDGETVRGPLARVLDLQRADRVRCWPLHPFERSTFYHGALIVWVTYGRN